MGILEIIFGKKKGEHSENIPEKKEEFLSIEDVDNYLSKKSDEMFEPFKKDANNIYEEIQSAADNLQKTLNELGRSEFIEKVDSELLHNVLSHRTSFIRKMEIMIKQLRKPMQLDFDSILDYSKSISLSVSETNDNTVNDYRFVDRLFEKKGEKTIDDFKVISKLSANLGSLVKNSTGSILSIRNAQSELKLVKEETDALSNMKENLETLDTNMSKLKSEHEKEKDRLNEFENGRDWISFTELLKRKKNIEDYIFNLKSETMKNISRIEKPLRKLKNLVKRGTVKVDEEEVLKKYADSFFITMMEDRNNEKINSVLGIVLKNISEGKIDLKDKEKELEELRWILENDVFENILKKYATLEDDLKELEKNIKERNEPNIKNEIESRIRNLEKQVGIANLEIEKVKKRVEKVEKSVSERKISLEESLALLANKKIKLN